MTSFCHFVILCSAYLDDFLFMADTPAALSGIVDYMKDIGFDLNFTKSVLRPTLLNLYYVRYRD